jgi:hypothetical protein
MIFDTAKIAKGIVGICGDVLEGVFNRNQVIAVVIPIDALAIEFIGQGEEIPTNVIGAFEGPNVCSQM